MDFFSAVADPSQPILHNDRPADSANDSFAEAIASRFGSGALLTTRLTPVTLAPPSLRLPNSPMANMSLTAPPPPRSAAQPSSPRLPPPSISPSQFTTVTTTIIGPWIEDPTALILDIRPHAAYSNARVPRAVSLSVPSTLLKRPLFSLHRLADMLPSANARARFSTWRSASRILVYDADSSAIPESSNIYGLLRKFKNDGFQGDLAWLKGGFQAVWREKRDIIDAHPPTPDVENDDDDDDAKSSPTQVQSSVLRTHHLPMAAFSLSSTTVSSSPSLNPTNPKRGALARGATFPTLPTPSQNLPQPAFNPFFDAVRQNLELSQGITERIPLRLSRRVRHRIHDLPFPWLREIARRAAKLAPRNRPAIDSASSTSEESEDDENITSADVEEGKEALAMQFFKIEVAEQRRLMGIMEHHTKETMIVTSDMGTTHTSDFPYSITAGVEKGTKNRYRHIWPFEHARVRLHQRREADDDYVNASYVQPLGTNKRYIATQGPLPATFTDFWTLCWEQNVHVIVMLTREVENSMVKCGSYWTDTAYGPLRLRLVSTTGASSPLEESNNPLHPRPAPQRNLSSPARIHQYRPSRHLPHRHVRQKEIIRRVFELSHTNYPDAKPRRIIHLQYLEWPDMNVPDDPRGVLGLVKEMDEAVKETESSEDWGSSNSTSAGNKTLVSTSVSEIDPKTGISKQALGKNRPVLLHCSAGVGRTGGFIAVDAVLDAIRREMRSELEKQQELKRDENAMDVDVPSGSDPAPIIMSSVAAEKDDPMSNQGPSMETVSIPVTASGRQGTTESSGLVVHVPVVPTPSSDGTEPEASGSEKENLFGDTLPSTSTLAAQTQEWAENVSRADVAAVNMPGVNQRHGQAGAFMGTPELGPNALSSLKDTNVQTSSQSSSSSGQSPLDFFGTGDNATRASSGIYHFPQSSSFATSVSAGISSPTPSLSKNRSHSHSPLKNPTPDTSASPASLSVNHIPARPLSEPTSSSRVHADDGLEARFGSKPNAAADEVAPQLSLGWLEGRARRRSPSPMARAPLGESSATSVRSQEPGHTLKPSFALRAPPLAGAVSSDAEPPSRSVSPSADEGSVASQVSSYHTYLKNHHYQPIHAQTLPINLGKLDKGKGVRSVRGPAPVPERLTSPAPPHLAPTQANSASATTIDYKKPRALHGTATPPNLTSFEEPICEVVQDMREQRMSLCQSLRQYVFVHAAVLEGALMIVDEERELMRRKERERKVEMSGLEMEPERREKPEDSRVVMPEGVESNAADGGNAKEGETNRLDTSLNEGGHGKAGVAAPGTGWELGEGRSRSGPFPGRSDMASTSGSNDHSSGTMDAESGGYFGSAGGLPSTTCFGRGAEGNATEAESFSKPKMPAALVFPPAVPSLQRPRHPPLDSRIGKRSTSPPDYFRDGVGSFSFDNDSVLLRRPSVKRKQPSGEAGEIGTRNKRAQNESSSRERERERERERQLERRLSNGSHPHPRDVGLDVLTPGLVR